MRPWTAGQKRFSLRTSQIAQLNRRLPFLHYGIVPGDSTIDVRTPIEQLQIADFDSEISTQVALYHAGTHPRRIPVITGTESPVKMPSPASLNYKTLIK
jgi:hypothetical protein